MDVHQVFKYPFEQVVASFLRKVLAPPGRPGLAFSGAAPVGPVSARRAPAARRSRLLPPAPLRPRGSPHTPSAPPATGFASGMCQARAAVDFLEGAPSRMKESLRAWHHVHTLPQLEREAAGEGESRGTEALEPRRGCTRLVDLSSVSLTPSKPWAPLKPSLRSAVLPPHCFLFYQTFVGVWADCLASRCLSFVTCKMGEMLVPTSGVVVRIQVK